MPDTDCAACRHPLDVHTGYGNCLNGIHGQPTSDGYRPACTCPGYTRA